MCNPPVIGWWCSRNLNHQPSGSNRSGVHMLVLSLKLPSPTWMRALVSVELRDVYQIVMHIPQGGPRPNALLLFLPVSPHSPN